jgi:hypothetical protein
MDLLVEQEQVRARRVDEQRRPADAARIDQPVVVVVAVELVAELQLHLAGSGVE